MRSKKWLLVLGIAIFLLSFATEHYGQVSLLGIKTDVAPYRIQAGDKLSLKFFSNAELNEPSLIVRPDGFINPQMIGEVRAEGKTVAELKSFLEKQYVEFLLEPMLTVAVVEFVAPRIFVGGQVNKPGRYDLREAKTLMQAVFLAGSFTREAKRTMVIHARPNGRGDWIIRTADVMDMMNVKGTAKDVVLSDGDFIFVPDSKIAQLNKAVEAFRGLLPSFL